MEQKHRALILLFAVTLMVQGAFAQDPTKVEPAHYKLAFENEWVQVVNVHYGPHEKSGLHAHPGGMVVILTEGHLRLTDENGKSQEVFAKPGDSRWYPPFKHQVENLRDAPYNAVYIVVKSYHGPSRATLQGTSTKADEEVQRQVAEALLSGSAR